MLRARSHLLSLALMCACGGTTAVNDGTTPPSQASATTATAGSTSAYALDTQIIEAAAVSDTVYKMKIRVDDSGTVIKQAMYHRDEASVPEAVRTLTAERFPGKTITHYETELYADLGRIYEVEVDNDGTQCELAATPEGKELYTECHLDPASISAAAKATIESVAPGGTILEAESKKGPEVAEEMTVEVKNGDQEFYIRLAADGSLIQVLRRVPAIVEVPVP